MKAKNRKNYIPIVFIFLMIAFTGFSQDDNHQHSQATVARPAPGQESWLPVNNFNAPEEIEQSGNTIIAQAPLTNVLNGVHFYTMNAVCDSKKTLLLKLINLNEYPVQVEWQLNPTTSTTSVILPAMRDVVGDCLSTDENIRKLSLEIPANGELDRDFVFSSVKVLK